MMCQLNKKAFRLVIHDMVGYYVARTVYVILKQYVLKQFTAEVCVGEHFLVTA